MRKKIAIIMGGYSKEYKISLKSGMVVYNYLNAEKFDAHCIHIYKDKWVYVNGDKKEFDVDRHDFTVNIGDDTLRFDCVFNAIHGTPGEDGLMPAYFELIGMPQTSCDFYQSSLTFNKRDFLSVVKTYGIKSAASYHLNLGDKIDENAIVKKVGLPCFVKANKAGSSFGVSKVYKKEKLMSAIENAFKEDNEILIEAFLDGTEITVGVIKYHGQTKVLPITEIVTSNDFFDYEAKYEGRSEEVTPARISKEQEKKVAELAQRVYDTLKMKGFSRSEFIFVNDVPYMLEMNTTPGLTEESILPQQASVAGISLSQLFESAIDEALNKK